MDQQGRRLGSVAEHLSLAPGYPSRLSVKSWLGYAHVSPWPWTPERLGTTLLDSSGQIPDRSSCRGSDWERSW